MTPHKRVNIALLWWEAMQHTGWIIWKYKEKRPQRSWLWAHVHRPICAIRWQEHCLRQITRTAIVRNRTGVHHLIWQCRSGIAWFSDRQCHTRLYIWPEATTERICKGTSISNDWCIPEQSHDSHAEAGRKRTVWISDAMTFQALPEISSMRINE